MRMAKVGTALNPIVWFSGAVATRRRVVEAVGNFAMLPGPESLLG